MSWLPLEESKRAGWTDKSMVWKDCCKQAVWPDVAPGPIPPIGISDFSAH